MPSPIRIVHVDDEPESLDLLRALLSGVDGVEYLKGFTDPKAAALYLGGQPADIAILDIEMSGEDGFWLADQIKHLPLDIVFLSSHSEFAINAFEACALDFIVKPATPRNISELLLRYNSRRQKARLQAAQIAEMRDGYLAHAAPSRLFINTVNSTELVMLDEVLYLTASQNYTEVHLKDGSKHTSSKQLKIYEDALVHHPGFVRIHRSHMVQKSFVRSILRDSRRHRVAVVMSDGRELEISFQKKDEILQALMQ